jgi:membrane-associated phospholipid phosphatase
MRAPLHPAWVWLPPCAALAAMALIVATGSNRALFLLLNRGGHVLGDGAWLHLTVFGDGAVALALVLPCIRRAPRCFWAALVAAVFAALWTQATKQVIDVPRPLAVFRAGEFFHAGPAYRQVSFPSGHAAAAFALAGIAIMGQVARKPLRILLLLAAGLVGVSRIMIGVHWPLDVLWGMLGGWLGAWTGLALYGRWGWRSAGRGGMLAGLVLLGLAASLLFSHHVGIPDAMPMQRVIGCACLLLGAWERAAMMPWLRWFPWLSWLRGRRRRGGAAKLGTAKGGTAKGGTAKGGTAKGNTAKGSTAKGSTAKSSTATGSTAKSSTATGSTVTGSTAGGHATEGSAIEDSAIERRAADG